MKDTVGHTLAGPDPVVKSQVSHVFSVPFDTDISNYLQEWRSLGHYILHKLETVCGDRYIYVSRAV